MTAAASPRRVVDLDALAGLLADALQDPTYALDEDVAPDSFVRFNTEDDVQDWSADQRIVRATVTLASDGEDPINGAAGEVVEIVVRRVTP